MAGEFECIDVEEEMEIRDKVVIEKGDSETDYYNY